MLKITIFLLLFLASCSKSGRTHCYRCDFGDGAQDYGCYSKEEWRGLQFTDGNGRTLDKSHCR